MWHTFTVWIRFGGEMGGEEKLQVNFTMAVAIFVCLVPHACDFLQ